ncbi:hypothetical protein PMAYCL1PPCAC_09029, partial [Pristionchus mayeri]
VLQYEMQLVGISQRLSQFGIIDEFMRIKRSRNDYIREDMAEFRGSTPRHLSKHFLTLERHASKHSLNAGYSFRLPRTYPGSIAWYNDMLDKAMVLLVKIGKPDIFLTYTGFHEWPEIMENLFPNTNWQSNPLLVCTVFYLKVQEVLDDVMNKEVFGKVAGFVYSIEFQKRGMPHLHLLIILKAGNKMDRVDQIDKHVWARIPEVIGPNPTMRERVVQEMQKRLRKDVKNFMLHAPCLGDNSAYCQQRAGQDSTRYGTCTKKFPKQLSEFTRIIPDGTVMYRRPEGVGIQSKDSSKDTVMVTNEWVVPYSPYFTAKYGCHVNVEVVATTHIFKYLFKYIYKGNDAALMEVHARMDNPSNDQYGNSGDTVLPSGALLPTSAAKNVQKATEVVNRMRAHARKMGAEGEGEVTVNYDEAILNESYRETTACEAAWGISGYELTGRSHTVKLLSVHEPDEQPVVYKRGEEREAFAKVEAGKVISPFMAYMNRM